MTASALSELNDKRLVAVLKNVSLSYGKTQALDDLSLDIPAGSWRALSGQMGSANPACFH